MLIAYCAARSPETCRFSSRHTRPPSPTLTACGGRRDYRMNRRQFMTLLGGPVGIWPSLLSAQTTPKVYRLGLLTPGARRRRTLTGARGRIGGRQSRRDVDTELSR